MLLHRDDIKKIFQHITKADGECRFCAEDIAERIVADFPETAEIASEVWREKDWTEPRWEVKI